MTRKSTNPAGSRFFAPGTRLMGNLGFPAKAALISLVFLAPLLLLGYFFVTSQAEQRAFSAKERTGVQAYTHFYPVNTAVLQIRNVTRARLGGLEAAAKFDAAKGAIDRALAGYEQYLVDSKDPLNTREAFDRLRQGSTAGRCLDSSFL